jgi:hypothetical protein
MPFFVLCDHRLPSVPAVRRLLEWRHIAATKSPSYAKTGPTGITFLLEVRPWDCDADLTPLKRAPRPMARQIASVTLPFCRTKLTRSKKSDAALLLRFTP